MAEPPKHRVGYEDSLNLTTSLCLTYTVCTVVLRVWVRRRVYGIDDFIVAVATLICIGHFGLNYAAFNYGAGKPWDRIQAAGNVDALNNVSLASVATFALSLYLSKCTVLAFLLRLTERMLEIWLYRICIAIISILGLASTMLVTVAWPAGFYWAFRSASVPCDLLTMRWTVFTALDIFTEVVILALPIYQIWSLQMPLKKKAVVIAAFWLRLPVLLLSVGRHLYIQRLCSRDVDPGMNSALVLIWLEVEVSFALLSSTLSALKAFTTAFNSSFGLNFTMEDPGESYTLSRMDVRSDKGSRPTQITSIDILASEKRFTTDDVILVDHKLGRNRTEISANGVARVQDERRLRREPGSVDSERTMDGMVIVRETEYVVLHQDTNDKSPILSNSAPGWT